MDAAVRCFAEQTQVSMTDIAREAGVGRVTLYGHFPSRERLIEAALERALDDARCVLAAADPDSGPADEALRRLLRSSWSVLDRYRRLFDSAQRELGSTKMREQHDPAMAMVAALIDRGRREGTFRTDLPVDWLVTTVYTLLHAAAEDVNNGRQSAGDVTGLLEATLLQALAPPV
ncbi:helix-turn-helix transcriptional regulator [Actinokineospora sp. HBU206404]|uniref:Helix-turn-helix transcriptional regulator n=2 Tax=Actinokineospora xionganensis TaxID=2684470 RepID=A0ABR7L0S8_9PSEU|nr:helix-turn-helix transcriptional regulator [Actinokineospora xionganensis]